MSSKKLILLPSTWRWFRFGDLIAETQTGFACGERDPNGVIQIRMNNLDTHGNFLWENYIRVPANENTITKNKLTPGDIIFNNTNSTELVGKSGLFRGFDEPVVYSNHFTRLRVIPELVDPEFLAFWLNYQWQTGTFERICNRWIGQSAIKSEKLFSLDIAIPSLIEQQRIAAILNVQMAAVEKAREAAEAQLIKSKELLAAILHLTFENPEIKKWPVVLLGEVLHLRKEIVHPYNHPQGSSIFVGLEHIEPDTGIRTGEIAVEMSKLNGRKPRFCKGDILYGYLRPYLNKVWVAEFDGLCSVDQYVYIVDKARADTLFITWFMRSPVYLERAPIKTTPGQLPRIRTEEVASVQINLPSLVEQQRLSHIISGQLEIINGLRKSIESQLEAINLLVPAILRKALNGDL